MYRTNLVALLSKKDLKKFSELVKERGMAKRDIFLEALTHFKKQILKSNQHKFKYQDIDRVKDSTYTIVVFDDIFEEVDKLGKKFNIGRNRLMREIICEYLQNIKI